MIAANIFFAFLWEGFQIFRNFTELTSKADIFDSNDLWSLSALFSLKYSAKGFLKTSFIPYFSAILCGEKTECENLSG